MIKPLNAPVQAPVSWRGRWPEWIGYVAVLWSLAYGALGLYWALGGGGFPFGIASDPVGGRESLLGGIGVASGAPTIAILGLIAGLVALALARMWGKGPLRTLLLVFACLLTLLLLIILPDRRVLMAVAYAPVFLVGYPFHWPPVSFSKAIPWPVINQFILLLGGVAWALTTLSYYRRTRQRCVHCGRGDAQTNAILRKHVLRWGKWAVLVAVLAPVVYAMTRLIWALGIPLGISEQFLREGQASGLWLAGATLASVAVVGAILTLGLVQHWGEVFPRWMIGLAGRRVPPALAIVPASLVSIIVTSAGLEYVRAFILQINTAASNWTTMGPELLWPLWGVALGLATLAYYYRRRGRCRYCNQV